MERLKRLIELLPDLVAAGLLDAGGGSVAVRTSRGVVVSPTQASRQLRWKLSEDDFVLFPGPGEASMARAGRQPSRENGLHRAVLNARQDWNCTLLAQGWGLIGFALAGRGLPVPEAHSGMLDRYKAVDLPVVAAEEKMGTAGLADAVVKALRRDFGSNEHGAVLIGDYAPFIAGVELDSTLSLAQTLETLARAQLWTLKC